MFTDVGDGFHERFYAVGEHDPVYGEVDIGLEAGGVKPYFR